MNRSAFVQHWLYFEVLRAVLGHLPDFNIEDFVRSAEGTKWVTTKDLPRYLNNWSESFDPPESQPNNRAVSQLVHARLVLDQARNHVVTYCSVSDVTARPRWAVDENVALSIMVLGQTITHAMSRIQQLKAVKLHGWLDQVDYNQEWGYTRNLLQAFGQSGNWCQTKVKMMQRRLKQNTVGLLFVLHTPLPERENVYHFKCTETQCKPMSVSDGEMIDLDIGNPEPVHLPDCNRVDCRGIGLDKEKLRDIIDRDNIPLLQY